MKRKKGQTLIDGLPFLVFYIISLAFQHQRLHFHH